LEIYCEGVFVFSPSWGVEFLEPLAKKFGNRVTFVNTENPSVKATLEFLKEVEGKNTETAHSIKHGKRYPTTKEMFHDILKKDESLGETVVDFTAIDKDGVSAKEVLRSLKKLKK
jgi:hypothetical protein